MDDVLAIIEQHEAALRAAMLANDVESLEALLDDDLVFTAPDGQIMSQSDDLAVHRAKLLRLDKLDLYGTAAHAIGDMILVTTRATLAGQFDSMTFDGTFAYTRLWRRSGNSWRVVAGHASAIA